MNALIELTGSEKQIAWAEKIRNGKLEGIRAVADHNPELTAISDCIIGLARIESAKFWIDHRDIPPLAFLAYAYKKLDLLGESAKTLIYYQRQSSKINGAETGVKLVPLRLGFIGSFGKKLPSNTLLHIELHEKNVDDEKNISLVKTQVESTFRVQEEEGVITKITPVAHLLDGGWASKDIEIVVLAIYLDHSRLAGDNKAYIFEQIK